jgi:citrate lyase subunit beta / citryl-CoA lyase
METSEYLMRSLMFVPGHNEKLIQSAANSDADVILLDVEDSVLPIVNKQIARDIIEQTIVNKRLSKFKIFVRVNEIESGFF